MILLVALAKRLQICDVLSICCHYPSIGKTMGRRVDIWRWRDRGAADHPQESRPGRGRGKNWSIAASHPLAPLHCFLFLSETVRSLPNFFPSYEDLKNVQRSYDHRLAGITSATAGGLCADGGRDHSRLRKHEL
jgi:hypothetical protein